jgi:hypothetical protein
VFDGDGILTNNENDLCVVAVVRFGKFDAVISGKIRAPSRQPAMRI